MAWRLISWGISIVYSIRLKTGSNSVPVSINLSKSSKQGCFFLSNPNFIFLSINLDINLLIN